ncbi:MAG: 3-phosphoshikimate 1-carboxyvinyltransferase [Saprospiraceae bacterium]|nr:3-phosphoshikimate 1-carboxyvinyltransferase [Candidatus Vicinibacter affinis]
MTYQLNARGVGSDFTIALPGSKSETNRLLIIEALSDKRVEILNPSEAQDSQIMVDLIQSKESILNVGDAGTVMRFLAAYFTLIPGERILTGSARMLQRPIGPLVDALRSLGGTISYLGEEGFPPIKIKGGALQGGELLLEGKQSSQFASALILIASSLPGGLTLQIPKDQVSGSYIDFTLRILKKLGIEIIRNVEGVRILSGDYQENKWVIEGDYSAASYWYEWLCFLPNHVQIKLPGLYPNSYQPDGRVVEIFKRLGIDTVYDEVGVIISKNPDFNLPEDILHFDCIETPDLAQTIAVACAGLGISVQISGLSTLRIKETDRIHALEIELRRLGLNPVAGPNEILIPKGALKNPLEPIQTYGDHRMVMAFTPLVSILGELSIFDPLQVKKSYPGFWDQAQNFCKIRSL